MLRRGSRRAGYYSADYSKGSLCGKSVQEELEHSGEGEVLSTARQISQNLLNKGNNVGQTTPQ